MNSKTKLAKSEKSELSLCFTFAILSVIFVGIAIVWGSVVGALGFNLFALIFNILAFSYLVDYKKKVRS